MDLTGKKFRYENKYILTTGQNLFLKNRIEGICFSDSHVLRDNTYTIRSVYFDDYNSSAYRDNEIGVDYRTKYRIRIYNCSDEQIVLERKIKKSGKIYKERSFVSKDFCELILQGRGEEVTLSLAEVCNAELQVEIRVCYEMEEVENLEIVGYAIDGKEDVICIRNNGQLALRLSDYCISDSPSNTSRGRLPDVQLMPGEEYYIYGKGYTGKINDNGTMVAFGWTKEEPVLLCHKSKGLIDQKN